MAGMQFEYDEEGGTFYYFLFSFWGLVLLPSTYYFWPKKSDKSETQKHECHCAPCLDKNIRLEAKEPWKRAKTKFIKFLFILGWIIFLCLAYKVSRIQMDYIEYDPYIELGVDRGASQSEIKKAYRKLSLVYHPDKETGDSKKFMRIAKAYAALTDEESRKNWEEFGNPDGPEATKFGIALPKWIVERENSIWVLGLYALIFMIMLPTCVGIWWYRSIKFSGEEVLMDTTQLYYYFFHKTPNMILKRVIMILGSSFEFERYHNADIIERESDNIELPAVMRYLNNLSETNKERPLCYPYSVKSRTLIHAHIQRHPLPPNTLAVDQRYILSKCPPLINEMVSCVAQLVAGALAGKFHNLPRLETVENCMKLSQMIVQGLTDKANPILQLPHMAPDLLKHFNTKHRCVRNIRDFSVMDASERRTLLRSLSEPEYADVMRVLGNMPLIEMSINSEVLDDEDPTVTAGSIVTVTVFLKRRSMSELVTADSSDDRHVKDDEGQGDNLAIQGQDEEEEQEVSKKSTQKVWQKNKKGKKKGGGGGDKKKQKGMVPYRTPKPQDNKKEEKKTEEMKKTKSDKHGAKKTTEKSLDNDIDSDAENHSSQSEDEDQSKDKSKEPGYEDDDWTQYQEESRKENSLETKSKESHLVHCPYFPNAKHEFWWVYIADRKRSLLTTAPVQICSLKDEEEVKLKFSAPHKTGAHSFSVILRSDSYLDFDQTKIFKIDVKEAKIVNTHPQWDMSDEDDKEKSEDDSDVGYSSSEDESD